MMSSIVMLAPLMAHHGVCLSSACLTIDKDRSIDSFKSCQCHLLDRLLIDIPVSISLTVHYVVVKLVLQLLFVGCRGMKWIYTSIWIISSKKVSARGHEAQG